MSENYELTEREISALFRENSGNIHKRRLYVSNLAFDALIKGALGEELFKDEG